MANLSAKRQAEKDFLVRLIRTLKKQFPPPITMTAFSRQLCSDWILQKQLTHTSFSPLLLYTTTYWR